MRILITEDDPKLLKSLVHIFKLNLYAVDGVSNGIDAFDFAFLRHVRCLWKFRIY